MTTTSERKAEARENLEKKTIAGAAELHQKLMEGWEISWHMTHREGIAFFDDISRNILHSVYLNGYLEAKRRAAVTPTNSD